jgi:hypothetical protein
MTPREALIEKLVVSLHLNVPERQTLGSDEVSVAEVATVVKRLLERDGVFPSSAKPWHRERLFSKDSSSSSTPMER